MKIVLAGAFDHLGTDGNPQVLMLDAKAQFEKELKKIT